MIDKVKRTELLTQIALKCLIAQKAYMRIISFSGLCYPILASLIIQPIGMDTNSESCGSVSGVLRIRNGGSEMIPEIIMFLFLGLAAAITFWAVGKQIVYVSRS